MATKYARTVGGNWSTNATWSTTSGGSADTTKPVAGDTVYLDANSGNVTVDVANSQCAVLDCTNYTGTFTMNANMITTGNITLVSGMTFTPNTSDWAMGNGNITIACGGKSFYTVTWSGGTKTLSDTFTCTSTLSVTGQTSVTAGFTMNCGGLSMGGNLVSSGAGGTVNLTGGTWSTTGPSNTRVCGYITVNFAGNVTVSGTVYMDTGGGVTYSSGTITTTGSTLNLGAVFPATGLTLNTNGITWNNITIASGHTTTLASNLALNGNLTNTGTLNTSTYGVTFGGTTTISNNLTLAGNMTINAGATVTITAAKTVAVSGTFSANGTSGSHVTLNSGTPSSYAYFAPTTLGTVTYVDATDINSYIAVPVTLDTQTNQFDDTATLATNIYAIANTTAYLTYELNITANWVNPFTMVCELELDSAGPTWANPTMTSNTAPSGLCEAKTVPSPQPFTAFDHDKTTTNSGWYGNGSGVEWLRYMFATKTAIVQYQITTPRPNQSGDGKRKPKNWTLIGYAGVTTTGGSITRTTNWTLATASTTAMKRCLSPLGSKVGTRQGVYG